MNKKEGCFILAFLIIAIFIAYCVATIKPVKPSITHFTSAHERIDNLHSFISSQNYTILKSLEKEKSKNKVNTALIAKLETQIKELQNCKVTEEYVTVDQLNQKCSDLYILSTILYRWLAISDENLKTALNQEIKQIGELKEQIKTMSEKEHSVVIKKEYTVYNCFRRHIRCN